VAARQRDDISAQSADHRHMATDHVDLQHTATLLVDIRDGRADSFESLIRVCRPIVERQARIHAWADRDVDDIVQEVWIRLIQHSDSIRDPQSLVAWLKVVTQRTASVLGRRNARMIPTELADDHPSAASTEDQAISQHDRGRITDGVRSALGRLDETDRQLLLLLHREDTPRYVEVSRKVNRPVGSLGPTRQRLLKRLSHDPAVRRLGIAQRQVTGVTARARLPQRALRAREALPVH
jgi:RNA polymerase sigma factor (sigma-70 family)